MSGAGAFAGLLAIAALNAQLTGKINLPLLLGCFGASATLLFGAELAPPRLHYMMLAKMLCT